MIGLDQCTVDMVHQNIGRDSIRGAMAFDQGDGTSQGTGSALLQFL
jgi:hypothetical protein